MNHKSFELTRRGGQGRFLWGKQRREEAFKLKQKGRTLKRKGKVLALFELIKKRGEGGKGEVKRGN